MKCWQVVAITKENIKYKNYVAAKTEENAIANFKVNINEEFTSIKATIVVEDGLYKVLGTKDNGIFVLINSRAQLCDKNITQVLNLVSDGKVINKEYIRSILENEEYIQ